MADVIIEPGQSKNLAFDIGTQFTESLELLHVVKPNFLRWEDGAPAITFSNETRPHDYDDTREIGPVFDEVDLREVGANRKIYEHAVKITLTQQTNLTQQARMAIGLKFKTDFLNGASYLATYTFLRDTVGKIDFEGEHAENNVEWNYLDPLNPDNIRGLSYAQVRHAQSMLVSKRRTNGNDLVMIAPSSLQEALEKSNPFLYSQGGFPGMNFDSQALARTRGILTWWVPDLFFTDPGLGTDEIEGEIGRGRGRERGCRNV
jgi:hypothetical protein